MQDYTRHEQAEVKARNTMFTSAEQRNGHTSPWITLPEFDAKDVEAVTG